MGKNIRVEPEELKSSAAKLAECSETYKTIANQLMQDATTMQAAWEGEDNQAFTTQIKGFVEELDFMSKKLQIASDTLTKQAQNYQDRQNSIIDSVKQLKN